VPVDILSARGLSDLDLNDMMFDADVPNFDLVEMNMHMPVPSLDVVFQDLLNIDRNIANVQEDHRPVGTRNPAAAYPRVVGKVA
jgi:hypothetical protein